MMWKLYEILIATIVIATIGIQLGQADGLWSSIFSGLEEHDESWNHPGSVFEKVTGARSDVEDVPEGVEDDMPGPFVNTDVYDTPDNKFQFKFIIMGRYFRPVYEDLSSELEQEAPRDLRIKKNMWLAVRWLKLEHKKRFPEYQEERFEALKQFTALTKITEENRCNWESYCILVKNDRATDKVIHKPNQKFNRISYIVYEYSRQHALACYNIYPVNYRAKREQIDQAKVHYVEDFLNEIISKYMESQRIDVITNQESNFEAKKVWAQLVPINSLKVVKNSAEIAYDKLKSFATGDQDEKYLMKVADDKSGKLVLHKDKIKELITKYLIEPCGYYVKELERIYIPASNDAKMLSNEDRDELGGGDRTDFYHGFVRYRVCEQLIKHEQGYLIKGVTRVAEQQA